MPQVRPLVFTEYLTWTGSISTNSLSIFYGTHNLNHAIYSTLCRILMMWLNFLDRAIYNM